MKLEVYARITDLEPAPWDALVGDDQAPFLDHGYLAALELSGSLAAHGFSPRHLGLWDGGRLVAAAACYLAGDGRYDVMHDWAREIATRNELPYGETLRIGVPHCFAGGRKLLVDPTVDREAAVAALIAAAKDLVGAMEPPVIQVYLSTADEVSLLERAGFHRRITPRFAWLNEQYRSFDDFLARFEAVKRSQIRRDRARVARTGIRIRTLRGNEIGASEIELVWEVYRRTLDKYGPERDVLTREFFTVLHARLAHRMEIHIAERDGKPIACVFSLVGAQTIYPLYWGMLEDVRFLYFEIGYYHAMDQVIARGLRAIDSGGPRDARTARGFVPIGYHHSATWIGDPDLDEAFASMLDKERAFMTQLYEQELAKSPLRPLKRA